MPANANGVAASARRQKAATPLGLRSIDQRRTQGSSFLATLGLRCGIPLGFIAKRHFEAGLAPHCKTAALWNCVLCASRDSHRLDVDHATLLLRSRQSLLPAPPIFPPEPLLRTLHA